jgi:Uma2 family endonuclease
MAVVTEEKMKWTAADLDLLPDSTNRYEIIDGDLEVTRAPHWKHQKTIGRFYTQLDYWSSQTGLGTAIINPGIIFTDADNIIPDVVWISQGRLAVSVDDSGHLITAPELIVEVLSDGIDNIRRDRETKLKLYSNRGVKEYWIADWRLEQLEIYRRNKGRLELIENLFLEDELTTPLLPGFSCFLNQIFA